jgi:hypothetical protein
MKHLIFALTVVVFGFFLTCNRVFACNLSDLYLTGVTSLGNGQYALDLQFCVGAGRTGTTRGADNDTRAFAFHMSSNASFVGFPDSLISPASGVVYQDTLHAGVLYYYNDTAIAAWTCVNSTAACGDVRTVCINITIITNGLPDSVWVRGAEAAGNLSPGGICEDMDMTVYPPNFECQVEPNESVFYYRCPMLPGRINLNPSLGVPPYQFSWSNGDTTEDITNLAPGTYTVTISHNGGACQRSFTYTVGDQTLTMSLGNDKTVYYGYGPQACTQLTPMLNYSSNPTIYAWSTGATSASINVCPTTTTTYSVTVTNNSGCTVTDAVTVNVVDVRCGPQNQKVKVCHAGSTLCVPYSQVAGHLGHGDALGNCSAKIDWADVEGNAFLVMVSPVPARDRIAFTLVAEESGTAAVEVYDLMGKRLVHIPGVAVQADEVVTVNQDVSGLAKGVYLLRVTHAAGAVRTVKFLVEK